MDKKLLPVSKPFNISRNEYPQNLHHIERTTIPTDEETEALERAIFQKRKDDLEYLNDHTEVRGILREFLDDISTECPKDIPQFCRTFFGQPKKKLAQKVNEHIKDFESVQMEDLVCGQKLSHTQVPTKCPSNERYISETDRTNEFNSLLKNIVLDKYKPKRCRYSSSSTNTN